MNGLSYFCKVENLSQHIEKLLAQHDYVVVPELGGFVVQKQSAEILEDKILAPCATIGFNPLMLHGDGLLAIEISRSRKLSYRQAMEFVQQEVANLNSNLLSDELVQLGSIGYLKTDNSGNIRFTPDRRIEFLPQNFGLSDLYITEKSQRTIAKRREITIPLPSRSIYKYAAVAMVVFGLFFVSERVSDVRSPNTASLIPALTAKQIEKPLEEKVISTETEPVQASVSTTQETEKNFHVIVACLATKESAEAVCQNLIKKNHKEAHILEPVRTYRVAIQSFADKDEAIRCMENLRKSNPDFEAAWVLCE